MLVEAVVLELILGHSAPTRHFDYNQGHRVPLVPAIV